jgi:hypothetical protein
MDERLLSGIIQFTQRSSTFPRILNCHLPMVFQHTGVPSPDNLALSFCISGIPCTSDIDRQFLIPIYAIFTRNDRYLPILIRDVDKIHAFILAENGILHSYLRD